MRELSRREFLAGAALATAVVALPPGEETVSGREGVVREFCQGEGLRLGFFTKDDKLYVLWEGDDGRSRYGVFAAD